jgi:hypothetical protein
MPCFSGVVAGFDNSIGTLGAPLICLLHGNRRDRLQGQGKLALRAKICADFSHLA